MTPNRKKIELDAEAKLLELLSERAFRLFGFLKYGFSREEGINISALSELAKRKSVVSEVVNEVGQARAHFPKDTDMLAETVDSKIFTRLAHTEVCLYEIGEEVFEKTKNVNTIDYEWAVGHLQFDMLIALTAQLPPWFDLIPNYAKPRLYVICGPTGSGKTTMIKKLTENVEICQIPKITTRQYRFSEERDLDGIVSIQRAEFEKHLKQDKIYAAHEYMYNLYGLSLFDLISAKQSKFCWLFDTCNPEAAFNLKTDFPDLVRTVLILTEPSMVEQGLIARHDTKRIKKFLSDLKWINTYRQHADHVLQGDYESNVNEMRRIIKGEKCQENLNL